MVASPTDSSAATKRPSKSVPRRPAPTTKRSRPAKARTAAPAENTRERILRVAVAEFSEKGYSGARVDVICRLSRANPRMIYHYFGGKDHLYIAVLEQVLGELRTEELKLDVAHVAPIDGMMQLFDFTYDHFGNHPELHSVAQRREFAQSPFSAPFGKNPDRRLTAHQAHG